MWWVEITLDLTHKKKAHPWGIHSLACSHECDAILYGSHSSTPAALTFKIGSSVHSGSLPLPLTAVSWLRSWFDQHVITSMESLHSTVPSSPDSFSSTVTPCVASFSCFQKKGCWRT